MRKERIEQLQLEIDRHRNRISYLQSEIKIEREKYNKERADQGLPNGNAKYPKVKIQDKNGTFWIYFKPRKKPNFFIRARVCCELSNELIGNISKDTSISHSSEITLKGVTELDVDKNSQELVIAFKRRYSKVFGL